MTKYGTDIAAAASSMMELPGALEGMLHDIHGQVEVSPAAVPSIASSTSPTEAKKKNSSKTSAKVLEQPKIVNGDAFWEQCATESQQPKTVGKDGNVSFCKVDKDILATFKKYVVGGYTTQTVVNAILRSFILHYKKNFNEFRKSEKSLL